MPPVSARWRLLASVSGSLVPAKDGGEKNRMRPDSRNEAHASRTARRGRREWYCTRASARNFCMSVLEQPRTSSLPEHVLLVTSVVSLYGFRQCNVELLSNYEGIF